MQGEIINKRKTAVFVIDIQNDYCSWRGRLAKQRNTDMTSMNGMVKKLALFVRKMRRAGYPIVFVRMDKSGRQMPGNLKLKLSTLKYPYSEQLCVPNTWGFEYFYLKPEAGDIQIIKTSYDAFTNRKIKLLLEKRKIKTVIITGVYSSICVDATVKGAFAAGYNVVIPKDLVAAAGNDDLQEAIIKMWNNYYAYVVNSKDIIKQTNKKEKPRRLKMRRKRK